ncbi:sodium/hydrogen exchanger family protein [Colletotrichum higginsianum]|nr:sodium/hydrogen exchanger family protein [Colletotrichum higginsianum]
MSTTAAAAATPTPTGNRAPSQGGIFEGLDPSVYNPSDPIILFIIQATIVIALTRLLYWPLSKINEPKVIAEVIAGILLGPSVFGRIPGFTDAIFPANSMAPFRLVANIGLVLFLFLVGLEINLSFLVGNWRTAVSVATLDMAIPFGCGVGLAYGLYHEYSDDPGIAPISFGVFALFIGVAIAITAFPVLCRILTSLKLLNTTVGVIVLTSGITNDVVGWVLLALCVTLVNSGAGVTAVWILLVSVGFALFLAYAVRPCFMWVLRRTRSLENGPTQGVVALTLVMVLASAFFTSIIGVHSIFGAFMVGLMCPHEGGFAIKLTEKIEDLIATLFVPLFFALSGINTNLGLLDSGKTWGYVIAIILVAFFSKVVGGTAGARMNGLVWRESFTIGTLMSCKGLVELIVLNIGLQAKILSTRTFTMFVVMALVTTFATTPLVMWLYPPSYQQKLELWKRGKINWDGTPIVRHGADGEDEANERREPATKLLVYLRTDGLSSLLSTISLFTSGQGGGPDSRKAVVDDKPHRSGEKGLVEQPVHIPGDGDGGDDDENELPPRELLRIHGCRLVGLTERNSSVMKVSEIEEYAGHDPIIKAFGTSASTASRDVLVSGQIAVVPEDSYAGTLAAQAARLGSDLVLVPWSETGTVSELPSFYSATTRGNPITSGDFPSLVADVFEEARPVAAVATYIDATLLEKADEAAAAESSGGGGSARRARQQQQQQLTRTASGAVSVSEQQQDPSAARFFSAERRGRKLVRVLYTGAEDDLFAVRLGLQLAQNENLDVDVVDAADPDAEANMQFVRIRARIHGSVAGRVTFSKLDGAAGAAGKDTTTAAIVAGLFALQAGEKRPTTYVLGRSGTTQQQQQYQQQQSAGPNTLGDSSVVDPRKTLGPVAAEFISEVQKTGAANVSLLVVQAKRPAKDPNAMQRKTSVDSSRD